MLWLIFAIACLAFAGLVCLVIGPKAPPAPDWPPCPPMEDCKGDIWRGTHWTSDNLEPVSSNPGAVHRYYASEQGDEIARQENLP